MLGLLHYMWSILQSCVVHITTKGSNMDRFVDISFSLYFHFQAFSYHVVQVWCKEWCALYIQRNLSLWDQKLYFYQYLIKSGPYWKPLPYIVSCVMVIVPSLDLFDPIAYHSFTLSSRDYYSSIIYLCSSI